MQGEMVDLLEECLASDDGELKYWALGLIHEYSSKGSFCFVFLFPFSFSGSDVATAAIASLPHLMQVIADILSISEDPAVLRVVLNIVWSLGCNHRATKRCLFCVVFLGELTPRAQARSSRASQMRAF